MGAREDLVRQHLEQEARIKAEQRREYEAQQAVKAAQRKVTYDQLVNELEEETARVAGVLEDADWTKAKLWRFTTKPDHWWQRNRTVEYACLKFWQGWHVYSLWMRSDNVLYVRYSQGGKLRRPHIEFHYDCDELLAIKAIEGLQDCIARLQALTSLESLSA